MMLKKKIYVYSTTYSDQLIDSNDTTNNHLWTCKWIQWFSVMRNAILRFVGFSIRYIDVIIKIIT